MTEHYEILRTYEKAYAFKQCQYPRELCICDLKDNENCGGFVP